MVLRTSGSGGTTGASVVCHDKAFVHGYGGGSTADVREASADGVGGQAI